VCKVHQETLVPVVDLDKVEVQALQGIPALLAQWAPLVRQVLPDPLDNRAVLEPPENQDSRDSVDLVDQRDPSVNVERMDSRDCLERLDSKDQEVVMDLRDWKDSLECPDLSVILVCNGGCNKAILTALQRH